jgi:hypothetical protein
MDEKAYRDSLDKDSINQLHAAVLQVSQTCYDIKKLCATIISSAVAVVVGLARVQTDVKIGYSSLLVGAAISAFFWFLDVQYYLLQTKMRLRMKELADDIAKRNGFMLILDGVGMPVAAKINQANLVRKSAFNSSMMFYHLLILIFVALALLQIFGILPSIVLNQNPR